MLLFIMKACIFGDSLLPDFKFGIFVSWKELIVLQVSNVHEPGVQQYFCSRVSLNFKSLHSNYARFDYSGYCSMLITHSSCLVAHITALLIVREYIACLLVS
jgi:hypothetical protein